jgi:V/A-type H+-transporting ATPase subunit D
VEDVNPTRSELLNLKDKIELAESGHKLLKKKQDGLILEFFEILKKAKDVRSEVGSLYDEAQRKMNVARTLESDLTIKSLALSISDMPEVELEEKNIVGVVVPQIQQDHALTKHAQDRGYGYFNSAAIDEAASAYERLLEKIIEVAEIETTMRKMLDEIEKTKRRVNALENEVVPRMQDQADFIKMRLDEQEREEFSRLKLIKSRLED